MRWKYLTSITFKATLLQIGVKMLFKKIFTTLEQNDHKPRFEIYDSQFEFIHEFKTYL